MGKCASREGIGKGLHSRVRNLPASRKEGESSAVPEETEKQPFFVKDRETPEEISATILPARKEEEEDELHEKLISSSVSAEESGDAISTVPQNLTQDDNLPDFPVLVPEETSVKPYHSKSRSASSDAAVTTLKYHEVQSSVPRPMQETFLLSTTVPVQEHSQASFIPPTSNAIKKYSDLSEAYSSEENIPTDAAHQVENTNQEKQEKSNSSHPSTAVESTATLGHETILKELKNDTHTGALEKDHSQDKPEIYLPVEVNSDAQVVEVSAGPFGGPYQTSRGLENTEKQETDSKMEGALTHPNLDAQDSQRAPSSEAQTNAFAMQAKESSQESSVLEMPVKDFNVDMNQTLQEDNIYSEAKRDTTLQELKDGLDTLPSEQDNSGERPDTLFHVGTKSDVKAVGIAAGQDQSRGGFDVEGVEANSQIDALDEKGETQRHLCVETNVSKQETEWSLPSGIEMNESTQREGEISRDSIGQGPPLSTDITTDACCANEISSQNDSKDPAATEAVVGNITQDGSTTDVGHVEDISSNPKASEEFLDKSDKTIADTQTEALEKGGKSKTDLSVDSEVPKQELLSQIREEETSRELPLEGVDSQGTDIVAENLSQKPSTGDARHAVEILSPKPMENIVNNSEAIVAEVGGQENKAAVDQASQSAEGETSVVALGASHDGDTEECQQFPTISPESITDSNQSNPNEAPESVELHVKEVKDDPELSHSLENELCTTFSQEQESEDIESNLSTIVEPDIDRDIQTALDDVSDSASETVGLRSAVGEIKDSSNRDIHECFQQNEEDVPENTENITELVDTIPKAPEIKSTLQDESGKALELNGDGIQVSPKSSPLVATAPQEDLVDSTEQEQLIPKKENTPQASSPDEAAESVELQVEEVKDDPELSQSLDKELCTTFSQEQESEDTESNISTIVEPDTDRDIQTALEDVSDSASETEGLRSAEGEIKDSSDRDIHELFQRKEDVPVNTENISELVDAVAEAPKAISTLQDESGKKLELNGNDIKVSPKSSPLADTAPQEDLVDSIGQEQLITKIEDTLPVSTAREAVIPADTEDDATDYGNETKESATVQKFEDTVEAANTVNLLNQNESQKHDATPEMSDVDAAAEMVKLDTECKNMTSNENESTALVAENLETSQEMAAKETDVQILEASKPVVEKSVVQGEGEVQIQDASEQKVAESLVQGEWQEQVQGADEPHSIQEDMKTILKQDAENKTSMDEIKKGIESSILKEIDEDDRENRSMPAVKPQEPSLMKEDAITGIAREEDQEFQKPAEANLQCENSQEPVFVRSTVEEEELNKQVPTATDITDQDLPALQEQDKFNEGGKSEDPQEVGKLQETGLSDNGFCEVSQAEPVIESKTEDSTVDTAPFEIQSALSETEDFEGQTINVQRTQPELEEGIPDLVHKAAEPQTNVSDSSQDVRPTVLEEGSRSSEATAVEEPPKLDADELPGLQSCNLDSLSVLEEPQESSQVLPAPEDKTHLQEPATTPDKCNLEEEQEVANQDININDKGCLQTDSNDSEASELHEVENQEFKEQEAAEHKESENCHELNRETAPADGKKEITEQPAAGQQGAEDEILPPPHIQDSASDAPRELNDELSQDAIAPKNFEAPNENVPQASQDITSIISEEGSCLSEATATVETPKLEADELPDIHSSNLDNLSVPEELQESGKLLAAPDVKTQFDYQESDTCNLEASDADSRDININDNGNMGLHQDAASELHGVENQGLKEQEAVEHKERENPDEVNRVAATADGKVKITEQTAAGQEGAEEELQPPLHIQDASEMTEVGAPRDLNVEVSQDAIAAETYQGPTDSMPEPSQDISSIISEESSNLSRATAVVEPSKLDTDKLPDLDSSNLDNLSVPEKLQENSQVFAEPDIETPFDLQESATASDICDLEEEQEFPSQDININDKSCLQSDLNQDTGSELHGVESQEFKGKEAAEHKENENPELNREAATVDGKIEITEQTAAGQEGAEEELQPPPQIHDAAGDAPRELNDRVSQDVIAPSDNLAQSSKDVTSIISEEGSSLSEATAAVEVPKLDADKLPDLHSNNLDHLPVPDELQESEQVLAAPDVRTNFDLQESATASDNCNLKDEQEFASQDININDKGCPQTDLNQDAASELHGVENQEFKEQEAAEHKESENRDELNREAATAQIQDVPSEMTTSDAPRELNDEVSKEAIAAEIFEAPSDNVPLSSQDISTISEESSSLSEATAGVKPNKLDADMLPNLHNSDLDNLSAPDELQESSQVLAASDVKTQDAASELHGVEKRESTEQEAAECKESENRDAVNSGTTTTDRKVEINQQTAAGQEGAEEELQPPLQIQGVTSEMVTGDAPRELNVEISQDVIAPEIYEARTDNIQDSSGEIKSIISEEDSGLYEATTVVEPPKLDADVLPNLHSSKLDNVSLPDEPQENSQVLSAPEVQTQLDLQESATQSGICNLQEERQVASQGINTSDKGNTACPQADLNQDAASELHGLKDRELTEQEPVEHEEIENRDAVNREKATADRKAEITQQAAVGPEGAEKELQPLPQIQGVTSDMTAGDAPKELNVEVSQDVIAPEICEARIDSSQEDGSSTTGDALPTASHQEDAANDPFISPNALEAGDAVVAGEAKQSGIHGLNGSMRDFSLGDASYNSNADLHQFETVLELRLGDHPEAATVVAPQGGFAEDTYVAPTPEPSTSPVLQFGGEDDLPATRTASLQTSKEEEPNTMEKSNEIDNVTTDSVNKNGEAEKQQKQMHRDSELLPPSEMFPNKAEIIEPEKRHPETPITTEEEASRMAD